jgi:acetyl-CoA C-acetyltransferase
VVKSPLALRVACGPKPSGGNKSAVEVSCAGSLAGQPSAGTLPEIVTVCPGAAVDGFTVTLATADAGSAAMNSTPIVSTAARSVRVPRMRANVGGMLDRRTPVLVGVGTCVDDAEAVELMVRACVAAGEDAGSTRLLEAVERVAVPQGTWSYTDPGRIVAARIGAPSATTHLVGIGIPQQALVNQALGAILAGDLDVAVIVGGEAKARAKRGSAPDIDQRGARPDVHQVAEGEILAPAELAAGLVVPVEQYALMESARRAADGITIDAQRREIAALWSRFASVASARPMTVDALLSFGPEHRPLAFPYGKWHVSQWTVDQAAALLLCSVEAAERFGVDRSRWIFPLVGVESSASVSLTKRRHLARWPAMRLLGEAAAERIGHPLAECAHAEVYSCFPVAVRVQQRELGLPFDGTPTITGGMTFAGGPFNNFVLQATAAMAHRLRSEPGLGLVTTVSGMLTKPGLAVWSSESDGQPPLVADFAAGATAATETVPVVAAYDGPATIAAYTVTYTGLDPRDVIAILETRAGRVIARTADPTFVAAALSEEIVGTAVTVSGNTITS